MDVKKQEKNIAVLLFLSDYKAGSKEADYRYVNGEIYKGKQTNDAPVECLLKMALAKSAGLEDLKSGSKLKLGQDKKLYILCITSYKVMTGEGKTAWVNFQDTVKTLQEKYIEKDEECKLNPIEVISIPYDYRGEGDNYTQFSEEEEDTNRMAQRIFGDISAKLTENGISDVYVDYTGGMRDISFLMTTIVRYLEFEGINCQKIVYSQYSRDNSDYNRIRDITYIYEMFQMINGVNEFVTTGRADALNDIFKAERDKAGDREEQGEYAEVKKLLENMVAFSKAMSICDVRKIDDYLASIRDSIEKLKSNSKNNDSEDDNPKDAKNSDSRDLKIAMLKQLLPLMEEKLYLDRLGQKDFYIKLINWCLENNMLQQALTLIEDKMPKAYVGEAPRSGEASDKVITYKFISSSNKVNFMKILGNSWDEDENKIFYSLDYWRVPQSGEDDIPNILEGDDCRSFFVELKNLIGSIPDQENVLRIKYNTDGRKERGYYKSTLIDSVLKCLGNNIEYKVSNKKKTQTETAKITMRISNGAEIEKLKRLFYLHKILKQERNDCNHASIQGKRFSFDALRILIENYIEQAEAVL